MDPLKHISYLANCDLCGADRSHHGTQLVSGREELCGVSVPISISVCRRCRFISQSERFSDELLTSLYELDTSFAFGDAEEDMQAIQSGLLERQEVISKAMSSHGMTEGAAVLDVGGGRGECCRHLVEEHRVVVADTSESPPVDPKIEKVLGLFSARLADSSFDVVVMNHVLEHVFSPTALLASAHSILKEDGLLIVEVPFELYTPLVARHLGDWRHVVYYCRATLRQFLEKSGFSVQRLALEMGAYGARRLPVIRAVARKEPDTTLSFGNGRGHIAPLLADMVSPVVLASLVRRALRRS